MLNRFKPGENRQASNEEGQVLLIFLMAMTFVFVIGVLVVDVGMIVSERRHAQTAADLAALAAAAKLDDSDAATIASGTDFAARNGYNDADPGVEVGVTPGYNGDPTLVEVTVSGNSPALFRGIFGAVGLDVGARAVAKSVEGPPTGELPALFAMSDDCSGSPPLVISGSTNLTVGGVHSNGDLLLNGSSNEFDGDFTYNCDFDLSGSGNTFDPAPEQTGYEEPPIFYEYSDFDCDLEYTGDINLASYDELWVGGNPDPNVGLPRLLDLVICATGKIDLGGQDVSGNVTLVAGGQIVISGSDFDLHANPNGLGVLFYSAASGDNAIIVGGSGGDFTGIIHAPYGQAVMSGSGNQSIHGSVIANTILVNGSVLSINSSGIPSGEPGPPDITLVD